MTSDDKVTYFAETDSRNKRIKFGIKAKDRTRHMYVIGKTGMGKSTLLENMAVQDIQGGEGLCFIDPHGKTAELLLNYVPEDRIKDVLYFAPFDIEHPISFNVMEDVGYDKRHLVVSGLMSTFKKIWEDAWSARMEYILSNTLLALLEYPGATLLGVNKMLSDKNYRKRVVDNVSDPAVKSFWVDEFAKYTERFAAEATPAIQNKIGQFTSNPLIRNIIGQPKSSFDIRKLMDERKILIVNLSKGRVGESNANLLGAMLITKIYLAAMSRADVSEKVLRGLPQFYLYVDEFQSFANESFADILSEARKYKLNLTIAHQYIEQMSEEVRAAVFGNVGTMIVFRVGSFDAEVLEKEFAPQFTAEDIVNLGFAQIYLRLMIDGIGSQPFSGTTLPPIPEPTISFREQVVESSRANFGQIRSIVEEQVRKQTSSEELDRAAAESERRAEGSLPAPRRQEDRPRRDEPSRAPERPRPPQGGGDRPRDPSREQTGEARREGHRDGQRDPQRPLERRERPVPPPPPTDPADGFQGLDALKNIVAAKPVQTGREERGQSQNRPREERKGVTEESKKDLRAALASLVKPGQGEKPALDGKPEERREEQKPRERAVEAPRPLPEPKKENPVPPKPGVPEVPEDVLKKILSD
ncbi:MAG: type IV secretion system DNA-binding domain-containing protein [Candidatus Taylorbacteria bacterium]|nr:type IV secretion system DNA-binding domain-containing protein [Candidatus Taylorbacteria bacterium]